MPNNKSKRAWTPEQGLAAQYAAQAGLDPDIAAEAGEAGWDALKALRDTADESDARRRLKRAAKTRRLLSKPGLRKHGQLQAAIAARLDEVAGQPRPNVNPETGLQEFFFREAFGPAQDKSRQKLTRRLNDKTNEMLPVPALEDRIANPDPQHTKEYWHDRLLHDQGGRVAMGQRVLDATSLYRGQVPGDLRTAEAIMGAVNHKYTPTGITPWDTPTTPEEVRDLYMSQGIDPQKYKDAPLTSLGDISGIAQAKTPAMREQDPLLAKKMIVTDPGHSSFIFIDEHGDIRNRAASAETNDPLYPVYRSVNDWYKSDSDNPAHKGFKNSDQFFTRGARFRF